jgi:hypothetical protein
MKKSAFRPAKGHEMGTLTWLLSPIELRLKLLFNANTADHQSQTNHFVWSAPPGQKYSVASQLFV